MGTNIVGITMLYIPMVALSAVLMYWHAGQLPWGPMSIGASC